MVPPEDPGGGAKKAPNKPSHAIAHYVRCVYCAELFPVRETPDGGFVSCSPYCDGFVGCGGDDAAAVGGCASVLLPGPDDDCTQDFPCYSCGATFGVSSSQRDKYGGKSRCRDCVGARRTDRWKLPEPPKTLDEQLLDAVAVPCQDDVQALLAAGADPNYAQQLRIVPDRFDSGVSVRAFDRLGQPVPDLDPDHATTPLKIVAFRVSDCMLGGAALADFGTVVMMLVAAGAEAAPAAAYALGRYGALDAIVEETLR